MVWIDFVIFSSLPQLSPYSSLTVKNQFTKMQDKNVIWFFSGLVVASTVQVVFLLSELVSLL